MLLGHPDVQHYPNIKTSMLKKYMYVCKIYNKLKTKLYKYLNAILPCHMYVERAAGLEAIPFEEQVHSKKCCSEFQRLYKKLDIKNRQLTVYRDLCSRGNTLHATLVHYLVLNTKDVGLELL